MEGLVMGRLPNAEFWREKRVLVTGHTGFKGAWISLWLKAMGAEVSGIALPPSTNPNLFDLIGRAHLVDQDIEVDIRKRAEFADAVSIIRPQIVLHLAAKALVRESYRFPAETFDTNVMGTVNLLEALRRSDEVLSIVVVTTDKVYQNKEWIYPYREDDLLGGRDPYSASKAAADIVVSSYRQSYFADSGVGLASARAGNVIGGGDWSEDRLLPDAVRAWQAEKPLLIRRPDSVRPWQHVLEPIAGYLVLAEALASNPALAGAYNFGPRVEDATTVGEVIGLARDAYGTGSINFSPLTGGPHEAGLLQLETSKVRSILDIQPRWSLGEAVNRTMRWYSHSHTGVEALSLCQSDLADYWQNHE
jgi:CDP-glucose 4,6-dehydratase